jgi:AbrB family looped-hinge helix DNA binding protein
MPKEQSPATRLIRPLRGGQITIPADLRKTLGIGPETTLRVSVVDGELRIRPIEVVERAGGSPWFLELYDHFAPARREAEEHGYTDEQVDAAIDDAVSAVRRKRA